MSADEQPADGLTRKQRTLLLLSDQQQLELMFGAIGSGMSLRDWCVINGVVYSTVQLRVTQDESLRPLYEAARMRQAEAVLDEIKELEERLEGVEGKEPIDPKAAQVLIGSKQWRAERLNPRRYGQRSYQEVTTIDQSKAHLEELRKITGSRKQQRLAQMRDEAQETRVIEGQYVPVEPATK